MDLLLRNLISPVVLPFVLGMIARWVRSDLEIPAAIYQGLSIHLLLAIGLKGGVTLDLFDRTVILPANPDPCHRGCHPPQSLRSPLRRHPNTKSPAPRQGNGR